MAGIHEENFVSIRTLSPHVSWRAQARLVATELQDSVEVDYRDLLSAANEDYFHREYTVALDKYLELREKILVQSHPELPHVPHATFPSRYGADVIDVKRIMELSRRILDMVPTGDPVTVPINRSSLFGLNEVEVNTAFQTIADLGVDSPVSPVKVATDRAAILQHALSGDAVAANKLADDLATRAVKAGDQRLAADVLAASAATIATYQTSDRADAVTLAQASFTRAGDLYSALGDTTGTAAMQANLGNLAGELPEAPTPTQPGPVLEPGPVLHPRDVLHRGRIGLDGTTEVFAHAFTPDLLGRRVFLTPSDGTFVATQAVVNATLPVTADRTVGIRTAGKTTVVPLKGDDFHVKVDQLYRDRISATTLDGLAWVDVIGATFVAYIPHLFFYVLPLAIADTYAGLGRYQDALDNYTSALAYPYLNQNLELADLWRRMARIQQRWGDDLFRSGRTSEAKAHYETIVTLPAAIPSASPLYAPAAFSGPKDAASAVAAELAGGSAANVNPQLAQIIIAAFTQLTKIDAGLNFLGLSDDFYPVGRFRALQAAANYMADVAVAAEQSFIQFRSQAEQQKFQRIQLEGSVALNAAALDIERARLTDAALETKAANQTLTLSEQRRADAQANLDDWNTLGVDLTSMNAALSWAANAANDQDIHYTGVRYDGASHDYSGDVEDFYDTVGEKREWVNWEIQQNRLERQVAEGNDEVAVAHTRAQQAQVRQQIQQLNVNLAQVRLDASQEVLDYQDQRMFGEDLWFRLAADLEDLSRDYLDMAIETAFLMQRAYDLEFDRALQRIRLDYGVAGATGNGAQGLLGGDYLKRDIQSFTEDYFTHARKQNPLRTVVSLREEFPQAFSAFQTTGKLDFHTDLELFDRRWPGSYRRKMKRVEVFVQGLLPVDGVRGELSHAGVSTEWRQLGGNWAKHTRVLPADTMLLSSYQFRRDYALLQPPDDLLALFENVGPQGNWSLHLPASANDLDYASISDVGLVLYFDADVDETLAAHTKALYGDQGARSFVLSSRFQFPDEWFRLDAERSVDFDVLAGQFPRFVTDAGLTGFGVRLIHADGQPVPSGRPVTVSRASGGASVSGVTDANGAIIGDGTTMAPFAAWKGANPADTFTVAFTDTDPLTSLVDVQLAVSYNFTYRADAS